MFKAFVTLFSEADIVFYVLFVLALGLFILEVFIPGFGLSGFAGILMSLCAITERCVATYCTETQIIFYIFWCIVVLSVITYVVKISYLSALKRKQVKTKFIVKGNEVGLTEEGNPDYSFLVGKSGVVTSDLKPSGKVEIEQSIYDVTSTKDYIFAGSRVKVVKVYAQKIIVEKI